MSEASQYALCVAADFPVGKWGRAGHSSAYDGEWWDKRSMGRGGIAKAKAMVLQLLTSLFVICSNRKWQPSPSSKLTSSQGLGLFAGEPSTPQQLPQLQQLIESV
jgi:hypothetical protein